MTFIIHRDWKSIPNVIIQDDIVNFGWEKALILSNIGNCRAGDGEQVPFEDLYEFFLSIEKDRFYRMLQELIDSGYLTFK